MSKYTEYKSLMAFHPGSYIFDIIEDLNMTQKEFAQRLGTSEKNLSEIVRGEANLSADIAYKLEKLTGVEYDTWMNLQHKYEKKILEIEEQRNKDELRICDLIDFSYFKKSGFVENRSFTAKEKITELRRILNFSNLSMLTAFNSSVSYRNSGKSFEEKNVINSNIMLEIASNQAKNQCDKKLNKALLRKYIPEIRSMTLQTQEDFFPRLEEILLECGISLVSLPALKNASLNGATKKFKNGSVLLLITDRNKGGDIFWFSLFHEIAHILSSDFHTSLDREVYLQKEKAADEYAGDVLIPRDEFEEFSRENNFRESNIISFARTIGIHPAIVAGRLENDKRVAYGTLKRLKDNYQVSFHKNKGAV